MKATEQIEVYLTHHLNQLHAETPALFGQMRPQHMVEHLILTTKLSYGRIAYPPVEPSPKALDFKERLLNTDAEMGRGIRHPHSGDALPNLRFEHLGLAKEALLKAWGEFKLYYLKNSTATHTHPLFGALNHEEWIRFHLKHIRHHFSQFGLLNIAEDLI